MNKIDVTKWETFTIEDLFNKCELKYKKGKFNKASDISTTQTEEFNLPLVNAKHFNNGIMYYGRSSDFESESMTIDIVADGAASTGDVYAQPQETGVLYNAYLIKPKFKPTENLLLYFSTIIQTSIKKKFGYENKCTWNKVKYLKILLPVINVNTPDYEYMESYMKNIMQVAEQKIENLLNISDYKKKVNIDKWQEYRLGDLFYKCNLNKKNNLKKIFDVSLEKTDEFDLPLVNAKHYNNGIMYYGRSSDFDSEIMTLDIVQNGAAAVGDVYAQPQRTGVLEDAYLIKTYDNITSADVLQFLATVIQKDIKQHFSYDDKCTWDKAKEMTIHLPAKPNGEPDWEYMKNYMKNIMQDTQSKLDKLVCC